MSSSTESTQLLAIPASSTEPCAPWIPPEIIFLILNKLWEVPQTPQERSAFKMDLALVSRTWLTLVARITSRDVYISNNRSGSTFLRLLPERAPIVRYGTVDLFRMAAHQVIRQICRSLTIHIDRSTSPSEMVSAFDVLHVIATVYPVDTLPNLRHVSLQYTHREYDHILREIMRGSFPAQVTHLSLSYPSTVPAIFRRFLPSPRAGTWPNERAHNVRHLALSGTTPTTFVAAILAVCPNTETLELMNFGSLFLDAPLLPPAVRTLILHHPGVAVSSREMKSWGLSSALEEGLVPSGAKPPRIIVRSGTPDPGAFAELSRCCKRFDTELVYERDDAPESKSLSTNELRTVLTRAT